MSSISVLTKTFLYFAYGSNLLAERLHINNPSAIRKNIGKLSDYRLDFNYQSERWHGAAATIVPDKGESLWGAIWEINNQDLAALDRQEGVDSGIYFPLNVTISTPQGEVLTCRSYQLVVTPERTSDRILPEKRRPSPLYKEVILKGALESKLPEAYIEKIKQIPHNNYNGTYKIKINNINNIP